MLSVDKLSQTSIQLQILSESTGYVKGEFRVCMCALEEVHSRCKGSPVRWRSAGPSSAYPEQSSPSARSPTENSHICCWSPALSEMEYSAKHIILDIYVRLISNSYLYIYTVYLNRVIVANLNLIACIITKCELYYCTMFTARITASHSETMCSVKSHIQIDLT